MTHNNNNNHNSLFSKEYLYVDNIQQNQGFPAIDFGNLTPKELTKSEVKTRLKNNKHEFAEHDKFIASCCKFLKFLYSKQTLEYDRDKNGYVNLASDILKSKLGSSQINKPLYYKYIITTLKEIGYLEVNDSYYANNGKGKSKSYRVVLQQPHVMEIEVQVDEVTEKIFRVDDTDYLTELRKMRLDEPKFILLANLLEKSARDQAFFVYNYWLRNYHYTRVDTYGRIHTLITIMPKQLRSCFTIDDEPIYEIDLHACQPFLMLIAVNEHLNYNKHRKLSLSARIEANEELSGYVARIQQGVFYEHLYRLYANVKKAPIPKYKLAKFKKSLFINIFFSDIPKDADVKKIQKVFSDAYPTVFNTITQIKNKQRYEAVSWKLQQYETEAINEAINRLKSVNPNEFYLRFHDAILCKQNQCSYVAEVLDGVLLENVDVYGLPKSGTWGLSAEEVLESMNLEIFSLMKNNRFDKAVGKIKQKARVSIGKDKSVSKEDERLKWQSFLNYFNNDPANQERLKRLEHEYKTFRFIYPDHWSAGDIAAFNQYALTVIENHFDKLFESMDEGIVKYAEVNLDKFRKVLVAV